MGERVAVWSGIGAPLGKGYIVGYVTVYYFVMPDGSLRSLSNCERCPPRSAIEAMMKLGGILVESRDNPKIVLDDGTVKYGCQVWWQPIQERGQ